MTAKRPAAPLVRAEEAVPVACLMSRKLPLTDNSACRLTCEWVSRRSLADVLLSGRSRVRVAEPLEYHRGPALASSIRWRARRVAWTSVSRGFIQRATVGWVAVAALERRLNVTLKVADQTRD
jgi:hypothetical protein